MKSKIKSIPKMIRDSEIEKDEVVVTPNLVTHMAVGKKHSEGGINTFLPSGSLIFSSKLKADKEFSREFTNKHRSLSYADIVKRFDTEKELSILNNQDKKFDELDKETAQIMLAKKADKIEKVFKHQEDTKKNRSDDALSSILVDMVNSYGDGGKTDPVIGLKLGSPYFGRMANLYKSNPNLFSKNDRGSYTYNPLISNPDYQTVVHSVKELDSPGIFKYQKGMTGLNDDGSRSFSDEAVLNRLATFNHLQQNYASNWNHTSNPIIGIRADGTITTIKDFKNTDFNDFVDFDFTQTKIVDKDNMPKPDKPNSTTDNAAFEFTLATEDVPTETVPLSTKPIPDAPLSPISSIDKPIINNEITKRLQQPLVDKATKELYSGIQQAYKMQQGRDIVDLATLDVQPPAYRYKQQQIAYKRFLPLDTLSAERNYNMQKEAVNKSGMPEQAKQAYLNDLSGKYQDAISDTQIKNYQGDMANDNDNINVYNQVSNANRAERLNYDENYDQKVGLTKYNESQERLRLMDRLMTNFGKNEDSKFKQKLVNGLGEGYYFDGVNIKRKEGYVPSETNPLSAYAGVDEAIMKLLRNAKSKEERDLIFKTYFEKEKEKETQK